MAQREIANDSNRSATTPPARWEAAPAARLDLANESVATNVSYRADTGPMATLRRKRALVLGIAGTLFAGVLAITLASGMEFSSGARLYLGELDPSGRSAEGGADGLDPSLGGQSDLASEIEIIRSRSLVSRAVLEAGVNVSVLPLGASSLSYGRWRWSGRDPDLLDVSSKELRAHRARLAGVAPEERRYEARFLSPVEYELWSRPAQRFNSAVEGERLGVGQLEAELSIPGLTLTLGRGSERGPVAGARYGLLVKPFEDVVDDVLKVLEVTAPKSSGRGDPVKVIGLSFRHASPALAVAFLERLMQGYLEERQTWKTADASAAEAFVTAQLGTTRAQLDELQKKLAEYRLTNRSVVLDSEAKGLITQIGKYEEQRVAARLELAALSDVDRNLGQRDLSAEAYMLGEAKDSVLEGLATALSQARRELTDLEARFNPSAPEVREQQAQVDAQLAAIRRYVRSRVGRAQSNLNTLDGIILQYEQKLRSVPEAEIGLAQLTREADVYGALYSNLLMRRQQTAIVKASTVSRNRVLDPARVAYQESSPRLLARLASGPLALLIAAGLVLLQRALSGTFLTEADVRRELGPLPILATVPKALPRRGRHRHKRSAPGLDLLGGDLNVEYIEAFRALRARLYQLLGSGGGKVILVTSPSARDGKTTCLTSLAAAFAADGKAVLVVDVDLRKQAPRLASGAGASGDLYAALSSGGDWRQMLRRHALSGGSVHMLHCHASAPVELLSSERMQKFLVEARAEWDFVLLDAPSFPLVSDALILAANSDAVLSVVRLEVTPTRLGIEHVQRLAAVARVHGLVVNDAGSWRPSSSVDFSARLTPTAGGSPAPDKARQPDTIATTPAANAPGGAG